jgi:proteasome accessory factor B
MARLERLVNLLAALSQTRRPLPLREIRKRVPGYGEGEAGRRAFERDKEQLRELGFDLSVIALGPGREASYQLRPEDWTMNELDLEPDEAAALAVAAQVARLEGEGDDPGMRVAGRLSGFLPDVIDPSFSAHLGSATPLHGAVSDAMARHRRLRFSYRPPSGDAELREVEPYGLVLRNGRWYLVGRDVDRDATRNFRLDRIDGQPEAGEQGAFERPEGFDPASVVPREPWEAGGSSLRVRLALDAELAWWARRQLASAEVVEERADGSVVVEVAAARPEALLGFVASLLDGAEILGPPEMREALVAHVGRSEIIA